MQAFSQKLHLALMGWYISIVPRHRRPRRSRPHTPVALAATVLAMGASLMLATLAAPTSSGAPVPAVARVVSLPGTPTPTPPPVIASGAGLVRGTDSGGQRDRRAIHLLPTAPTELSGYQWPLPHGRITSPFGPWPGASRIVDGEPFHDGLDVATFCGDQIVAAHAGVVVAAGRHYDREIGWVGDLGPYLDRLDEKALWVTLPIVVVIDDGNGYRSMYAHFEKIVVKRGQTVRAGQLLGLEGRTGHASGCHLHYGLFSPEETARFGIDPIVAEHMKLPAREIARIDPLVVLPQRTSSTATPDTALKPRPAAAGDPSF